MCRLLLLIHEFLRSYQMNEMNREICINITRRCNLHCPECYVSDFIHRTNSKGMMDLSLDAIKQIVNLSTIDGVYLTGGEPFAHPGIRRIIDFFHINCKKVSIATNGLLLSEELLDFLNHKNVTLLVSLREDHKEVFRIINQIAMFDIEVICYHLPLKSSPDLLFDFIQHCPSVKKIKLLYDSKEPPKATEWFSLLKKIHEKIKVVMDNVEVTLELGFLPKQNQIAMEERRGAFDRIHISTEGLFFNCPLMVLDGNGKTELPPEICTPEKCPVLAKNLDDDKFSSVCCFLVTSLENAVLLARWGNIK